MRERHLPRRLAQPPPKRPAALGAYLGRITRNLSLGRIRAQTCGKRGGGEVPLCLDELSDCVSSRSRAEERVEVRELASAVNYFLGTLNETERDLFVCRYFFAAPVGELAGRFGYSEGRVRTRLSRTRARLRRFLETEGYV